MNQPDLAELERLLAKMEDIRADFEDFDGDRRGIGECLSEAEIATAFELAKHGRALIECAKALEPFADLADAAENAALSDPLMGSVHDEDISTVRIQLLRRARKALSTLGGSHGQG